MNPRKRKALEAAGWTVGTVEEMLNLTPEEEALATVKANLARAVRDWRVARHLSQAQLATRLGSTQPKVCDLEHGRATLDGLFRALLALGANRRELARVVATAAA